MWIASAPVLLAAGAADSFLFPDEPTFLMRRPLLNLVVLLVLVVPTTVLGQSSSAPGPESPQAAAEALHTAQQNHLWRVGVWGGANAVGGLALVLASSRPARPGRWNFGAMTAGWGAVNVGIAAAGLLATTPPPAEAAAVLDAERQFHDILLFNLGLNVAYSAVGGTMLAAGYRDVGNAARWRGFGSSLILQGAGLLVLDGIAFVASRTRLAGLLDPTTAVSLQPLPTGVALTAHF